jgi:putative transposase
VYLFQKLFRTIVHRNGLSDFWRSIIKHYRVKLDNNKIRYIIMQKKKGKSSRDIADSLHVSCRRVQQVYKEFMNTDNIPSIKKAGRKRIEISEEEKSIVLSSFAKYMVNAAYLAKMIAIDNGIYINHNRVHRILKMNGLASDSKKKWIRRKWIRYEREYSNSLWHVDWHCIKDDRWKDEWLICYEDDASRYIPGYGVYEKPTSKASVDVLDYAIAKYGKPASIISDHGSQFYAVEAEQRDKGLTEFEIYLLKNKIRMITGRVNHPQTNGKIEKFFDIFESKIRYFSSIDEFMQWYNCIRPHGAIELRTPIRAYYDKMPRREMLMDPSLIWSEE